MKTSLRQQVSFEDSPVSGARRVVANVVDALIFYALIAVVILTAVPYGTVEAWSQAVFECCAFALGLLWVIQGVFAGSWRPGNLRLFYPLLALIVFAIFQSVSWSQTEVAGSRVMNAISADPFESWLFALRVSALTLAGVLAVQFARGSLRLRVLVHGIISLALASAVFGIIRQAMLHDQGFLLPALRYGGGYAQFINKNHFAFLVEPAMGLLVGITLLREHHRQHLLVYLSAIILLWAALVMSNSRGGLLAVTVQMIFAAFLFVYAKTKARHRSDRRGQRWAYSAGVAAATSIAMLAVTSAGVVWLGGDQLNTGIETAAIEMKSTAVNSHEGSRRRDIWSATWKMARAHPILGAGLGGFWAEVPIYHDATGTQTPAQAHNDYLELLASAGIVGLALLVWFAILLVKKTRSVFDTLVGFQRAAALGALVGIAGVAVHSLVDFGLHITSNALVFVMLLSILSVDKIANGTKRKGIKTSRSDNMQQGALTIDETV